MEFRSDLDLDQRLIRIGNGSLSGAAKALGISYVTLWRWRQDGLVPTAYLALIEKLEAQRDAEQQD